MVAHLRLQSIIYKIFIVVPLAEKKQTRRGLAARHLHGSGPNDWNMGIRFALAHIRTLLVFGRILKHTNCHTEHSQESFAFGKMHKKDKQAPENYSL